MGGNKESTCHGLTLYGHLDGVPSSHSTSTARHRFWSGVLAVGAKSTETRPVYQRTWDSTCGSNAEARVPFAGIFTSVPVPQHEIYDLALGGVVITVPWDWITDHTG